VRRLVHGDAVPLLVGQHPPTAPGAVAHAVDRGGEVVAADLPPPVAHGQQRGLVDDAGQVGAREAGRAPGQQREVGIGRQRGAAAVQLEDALTTGEVRGVDGDQAVEPARAQQRGVQDVGPVRGRHDHHAAGHVEAVHLDEQLVERLLPLVAAAAGLARAAAAAGGVDLVDEQDGGRRRPHRREQVAHPRGPDADQRLDELRPAHREEGHPGLARGRPGQQRLAGAGQAEQQHALGWLGAQGGVARGLGEVADDLLQLGHGLVGARDVGVGDRRRRPRARAAPAPDRAEGGDVVVPTTAQAHEQQGEQVGEDGERQQHGGEQPDRRLAGLGVDVHLRAALGERGEQLPGRAVAGRVRRPEPRACGELALDPRLLVAQDGGRDLLLRRERGQGVQRQLLAGRARGGERERRRQQGPAAAAACR
jgi:hypothetical protein